MPFQWQEASEGCVGTGTLWDYLRYPEPETRSFNSEVDKIYQERDANLVRLQLELFTKTGCEPSQIIQADSLDEYVGELSLSEYIFPKDEWCMLVSGFDDPKFALFKDGQPMAAYYASFRGSYQAGGYVLNSATEDQKIAQVQRKLSTGYAGQFFYARNFGDPAQMAHNVWHEMKTICGKIAADFLESKK